MLNIDYVAGFIDGEGCFSISSSKGFHSKIVIVNTDKNVLALIQIALANLGVSTNIHKHCKANQLKHHKASHKLVASSIESIRTLCTLLKGKLVVKEKQRNLMSQFVNIKRECNPCNNSPLTSEELENRLAYYHCMKLLNK